MSRLPLAPLAASPLAAASLAAVALAAVPLAASPLATASLAAVALAAVPLPPDPPLPAPLTAIPPSRTGCPRSRTVPQGPGRGAGNPHGRRSLRARNTNGAVTAEFAVALPAVLMLLAMLLAGSAAGITQLRLEEAARAGARALARGEGPPAVEGMVRKLAGATASSAVVADGEWLSVTVSDRVAGPFGTVVPWTLTARAEARGETAESVLSPQGIIPAASGTWADSSAKGQA